MTKILLVEDDKSLREIYGVRLLAEGYDIVTASDGEEALAIAIKEHPALIISDVMMPKISGFDMLDILKSTTETRNIKVIMMTALSSEEQRARGERIGADRYLVKSQVGIEDVVKTVHDVLGDKPAAPAAPAGTPQAQPTAVAPSMYPNPAAPAPQVAVTPSPVQQPVAPQPYQAQPIQPHTMPPAMSTTPARPAAKQRIIQPINDPSQKIDINELLNRELAKEAGGGVVPQISTTDQEKQIVNDQIQQAGDFFAPTQPQPAIQPAEPSNEQLQQPTSSSVPPTQPTVSAPSATWQPVQAPTSRPAIAPAPTRPDIAPPARQ
ncbi:MAG TPA: response regulator [Candidatus Saccharimonadales bacterium]|nr:response regulator [Candidatus Saccharimonadales bacterium]